MKSMDQPPTTERDNGRGQRGLRRAAFVLATAALCSVSSAQPAAAQDRAAPPNYEQTNVDKVDGLPSNSVYALEFDDDGYLWVGTLGGLARYDGFDFDLLLSPNIGVLESNRVRALLIDSTGALWIGSDNGPLVRKVGDDFEAVLPSEELRAVRDLLEASDGTIWGAGSSIVRWRDGVATLLGPKRGRLRARFDQLAEDADGVVWSIGNQGLVRLHEDEVEIVDPRATSGFFHDPLGALWVTLPARRAYRLDDPERREIDVPFGIVFSEILMAGEQPVLATDEGVLALRPQAATGRAFVFDRIGARERDVRCLLEGANDSAWLGTDRFGLSHVRPRRFRRVALPGAPPNAAALEVHRLDAQTAFVTSMGRVETWIVSTETGAQTLDWAHEAPLMVHCATPTRNGIAWVATASGLARLKGNELVLVEGFGKPATSVVRAADGTVWVLQGQTFVEVLADGTRGRTIEHIDGRTYGAVPSRGGFVCICANAVLHVDTSAATATVVFDPPHARPRAIAEDRGGALWVTTYGGGLFRQRVDGQIDQWTTQDGLPGDFLGWIGITEGDHGEGFVWLNSNRGLVRVEIESLDRVHSPAGDGLRSQLVASGESSGAAGAMLGDGLILLPTLTGLVTVDPHALKTEQLPPRVAVEWVEIDGDRLAVASQPRGSADLAFGYTAILFPRSADARFQYRLDGYDDGWIEANRERAARYTNIPPGDYTFRVRARAAGGPWSTATATDSISVTPLWFQQRLNQFLLAVGFVALLALAYAVRTRDLTHRSRVLAREVEQRRLVEEQLRESEQRYRQLFRTAPTAIIAWQPDRRIIDWNERAVELFGWPRDASPTLDELFSADAAGDLMSEAVDAVLGGRRDAALVHPTHIKGAEDRRCRWTFAPITGADGEVHTVISLVTDVTDDERIAQDMEGLRRKLARAEETERSRIARELHDDLSQRLAALAIEMQLLENGIEQRPVEILRSAIRSVHNGLDEVSTDVHALSRQLHPTVLDDLGLSRALRSECQRRRRASDVSIHFVDESHEVDVRNEIGLALFRIAQESVQNAIKHASAQEIVVRLAATRQVIELTISDDGVGFDAARVARDAGGGLGLASVQERARLIGADLEVTTAPGEGTSISVTAVLRSAASAPS